MASSSSSAQAVVDARWTEFERKAAERELAKKADPHAVTKAELAEPLLGADAIERIHQKAVAIIKKLKHATKWPDDTPTTTVYTGFAIKKKGFALDGHVAAIGNCTIVEQNGAPVYIAYNHANVARSDLDAPDDTKCLAESWAALPMHDAIYLQIDRITPRAAVESIDHWMRCIEDAEYKDVVLLTGAPSSDLIYLQHFMAKYGRFADVRQRNALDWINNKQRNVENSEAFVRALGPDRIHIPALVDKACGRLTSFPDEDVARNYWELWFARQIQVELRTLACLGKRRRENSDDATQEPTVKKQKLTPEAATPPSDV